MYFFATVSVSALILSRLAAIFSRRDSVSSEEDMATMVPRHEELSWRSVLVGELREKGATVCGFFRLCIYIHTYIYICLCMERDVWHPCKNPMKQTDLLSSPDRMSLGWVFNATRSGVAAMYICECYHI